MTGFPAGFLNSALNYALIGVGAAYLFSSHRFALNSNLDHPRRCNFLYDGIKGVINGPKKS